MVETTLCMRGSSNRLGLLRRAEGFGGLRCAKQLE